VLESFTANETTACAPPVPSLTSGVSYVVKLVQNGPPAPAAGEPVGFVRLASGLARSGVRPDGSSARSSPQTAIWPIWKRPVKVAISTATPITVMPAPSASKSTL
jgi:hypothetical protein